MRTALVLCLFAVYGFAYPQITISYSDFESAFTIGKTYKSYATPTGSPISVFVGIASATAQVWDFSTYTNNYVGDNIVIDQSTAPFYSQFPNTNVCIHATVFLPGLDTSYNWQYQRLESDKLLMYGVSDETTIFEEYDPATLQAVVPVYYGATWTLSRDSTSLGTDYYIISEKTAVVDAFGTLKLPSGDYECLRKTINNLSIVHSPVGIDTSRTRGYHFYSKNLTELHITSVPESQFNQSTIDINAFSFSVASGGNVIGETGQSGNEFVLYPNTPNPFNSKTLISYAIPLKGPVSIKIYDYLGKEVAILVNETMAAGLHEIAFDAGGLPDGLYFCQLKSGNSLLSRKLVLKK